MMLREKILRSPQAMIGLALIALLVLIALFADVLAPHDPTEQNILAKYRAPDAEYPLGTDQLGRCELSRLIYGARYSLGIGLPVVAVLGLLGLLLGCLSACAPKGIQWVVQYLCNVFVAFPAVVLAAALTGVIGNGIPATICAVLLAMWAWFVRMVRGYVLVELGRDYPLASRIAGCGTMRLILRHLIPNILPQYLVYLSTGVASTVIMISGFAFLGMGFPAGTPEWGAMLNEARRGLYAHPELLLYPGGCVALTACAFNLFGEALRDILERTEGS